jgi:hypothetical protein
MPEDSFGRRAEQVDTNSPSFVLTLFMQTADLRDKRRVLEQHPVLLSPGMEQFIQFAISSSQGVPGLAEALDAHRLLLARCQQVGVDEAFAEWAARPPAGAATLTVANPGQVPSDELKFTVSLLLKASTGQAKRSLVERHPELLSPEADNLLAYWSGSAQGRGDDDAARTIYLHRRLLLRCRQIGVDAAFAEQGF